MGDHYDEQREKALKSEKYAEHMREQGYKWYPDINMWANPNDVFDLDKIKEPVRLEPKPLTGGSSDYYKLPLPNGRSVEAMEIIEGLNLSFAEGNVLKALWRQAAARKGNGKEGTTIRYDREKIVYFGNRLLAEVV